MKPDEIQEGGVDVVGPLEAGTYTAAHPHEVHVTTRILPSGAESKFKLADNVPLTEVLEVGAQRAGAILLPPPPLRRLDELHNITHGDIIGRAIDDLDQPLGAFLKQIGTTTDFGIELVLVFRVNTRWAVATKPQMTPREILALPAIDLNFQEYTLYPAGSATLLPLDVPVTMERGEAFEAQRDGKYGGQPKCVPMP
jgi:hypothetical protein